jgi:hypothetical protein
MEIIHGNVHRVTSPQRENGRAPPMDRVSRKHEVARRQRWYYTSVRI